MVTGSVVTYHTPLEDIDNLIQSVEDSDIDTLFIIDNSKDDSLRNHVEGKSKIKYIKNINNGFGAGHNIAIKQSLALGAEYHAVINPDIYWRGPVIRVLRNYMNQHPECGLTIPKVTNPDGSNRYCCRMIPTPVDLIFRRFFPSSAWKQRKTEQHQLVYTGYSQIMEVPIISGCFMFMRCSILKDIGGFDERFFMYLEDIDISRRFAKVSKIIMNPEVSIVHLNEKGSYKNIRLLKTHLKSAIKYFNKWGWWFDKDRKIVNKRFIENNIQ